MDRDEMARQTIKSIYEFVQRVSSEDGRKSEAEVAILPQMIAELRRYYYY